LSFSLFTTSSLPTIYLLLFLFPFLFIYLHTTASIHRPFRRNTFQLRNKEV
jgi:hypothetical protein